MLLMMNSLLLCFKDSLLNTQSLSHRFGLVVGEGLEWKATWGRLEIKVQMIGVESLDFNTRVGVLSQKMDMEGVASFWCALSESRWNGWGINSHHQNLAVTHFMHNSVAPIMKSR